MRLKTKEIKAENCPEDVFVYDEENKEFIYVDNVEVEENTTTLIFEEDIDEDGIRAYEWTFDNYFYIRVVSFYNVNDDNFWL